MNDRTDAHLGAVLTAIDDITPDPPALPSAPTRGPVRRQPLLVAATAFVAVLIVIGVGLVALRPGGIDHREVAAAESTQPPVASTQPAVVETVPPTTLGVVAPQGPPHLILDLPDTRIADAFNIFDESTGSPVGIHTTYYMTLTDDPDGWAGRELHLRIQQPAAEFALFDDIASSAESTDIFLVEGREVTVYMIPDEAIAEGSFDQGILRWMEAPGYEAVLIPWGMGPDEALTLMDSLKAVSDYEWDQLTSMEFDTSTITTDVEADELIPLMPRVAIDLPGFEIVNGSEGQDGPAHWRGEWQIRIGDTNGTITLDSDQTTPSQTFDDYDTPERIAIDGTPGLLARYGDGFVVEWDDRDTRFTISIEGTDIDPLTLIEAIGYLDEATWRQLLPETTS